MGQRRACPGSSGSRPPACRARGGVRQRRGGRDPHAIANGRRHNLLRFWPSVLPYLRDDAFSSGAVGDVVLTSMVRCLILIDSPMLFPVPV
ncbi:hypothetical protein GQ55_8G123500 [Panicum hallii var. hallii]|uniref:Uncharacterized protein n=1 Tax=Panicum hallii var. hallii TaxID=1504633 RepID=A0A2T7CMS3_9POAL|nr:hypothetical protein GQ55_8G123500 [Panicum hallii var. hallii]